MRNSAVDYMQQAIKQIDDIEIVNPQNATRFSGLLLVIEGRATVELFMDGQLRTPSLEQGQAVLIRSDLPFNVDQGDDFKLLVTGRHGNYFYLLTISCVNGVLAETIFVQDMKWLESHGLDFYLNRMADSKSVGDSSYLVALWRLLWQDFIDAEDEDLFEGSQVFLVFCCVYFTALRFTQYPNREKLAAVFSISGRHLQKLMTTKISQGTKVRLVGCRLHTAATLLKSSSHSIADIARFCGYSNANTFSADFKKAYLVTPSRFRKERLPEISVTYANIKFDHEIHNLLPLDLDAFCSEQKGVVSESCAVRYENDTSEELSLYWVEYDKHQRFCVLLKPKQERVVVGYLGHAMIVKNSNELTVAAFRIPMDNCRARVTKLDLKQSLGSNEKSQV